MQQTSEIYNERMVKVSDWSLNILTYRLGRDYVCIVSNIDPSATLCRSKAPTEEEAIRTALENAAQKLHSTSHSQRLAPVLHSGAELAKICYEEHLNVLTYTPDAFRMLNHDLRAEMFLSGKLKFYDTNGHLVSSGEAIRLLLSLI